MDGRDLLLLERDLEVGRVEALCADAAAGRGRLLLVEGPAGIGKTSLLAAARRLAPDHGLRLLRARGSQMEREFPFGVVRQLLEPVLLRAQGEEREALLEGAAVLAERALSTDLLPTAPATSDPGFSALHGLYWLTANLAAREPLLLVVDDCHWADVPSLRYLAFLLPRLAELPVAVLAATRGAGMGGPEPAQLDLLDAFTRDPDTEVLRPEPLGADGVAALLELKLGGDGIRDGLPGELHRVTGGLPFLVAQAVSALRDQGGEGRPSSNGGIGRRRRRLSLADSLAVDSSVSRAVRARLANLTGAAEPLAAAVAVLERASLREAAELAGLDLEEAGRAADQLTAAEIFAPGRPLVFVHALVRAAIHASLPGTRRDALHRKAAALIEAEAGRGGDGAAGEATAGEAQGGSVEDRIAQHLLAVEPTGDATIAERLAAAARAALARGGPESAATYLRRALQEPPPPDRRGAMLFALGVAEARSGQPDVALEHLEAALEATTEHAQLVRIAIALGFVHARDRRGREAVEVTDRILDRLHREDAPEELSFLLEGVSVALGVTDGASMGLVAERAEALVKRLGLDGDDPAEAATGLPDGIPRIVLGGLALHAVFSSDSEKASLLAEKALAGGPAEWNNPAEPPSFSFSLGSLIHSGHFESAARHVEDGIRTSREAGDVPIFALSMAHRSMLANHRGDTSAAVADANTALDALGFQPTGFSLHAALAALAQAHIERGELEDAAAAIERAALAEREQNLSSLTVQHAVGRLHLARRDYPSAAAALEAVGRTAEALHLRNPVITPWRSDLALARAQGQIGKLEDAIALVEAEIEDARRAGVPGPLAQALRAAALIKGGKDAVRLLREAAAIVAGTSARLVEAKVSIDLGAALRRGNEREAARRPLRHGLELARACGARPLEELALTELKATGARARSAVYTGADALTPSERRVAEMAASGMTNRQIAQDLFVTSNTVETHLTSVYRKLDCPGRSELAAYLEKAGAVAAVGAAGRAAG